MRSNGTVTYVGKDIAYHLWKFGLLGRDFGYAPFLRLPDHTCWISTEQGEREHPHFGGAQAIYNVIDSRQADPQANVIEALRGLGYTEAGGALYALLLRDGRADAALRAELGYAVSEEDQRPALHRSFRAQGLRREGRRPDRPAHRRRQSRSGQPASGAQTRMSGSRSRTRLRSARCATSCSSSRATRVIAFDFKEALSFEGETGPYVQYAVVRARNIFRKAGTTPEAALADARDARRISARRGRRPASGSYGCMASKLSLLLEQCIATAEPAYLAKHAFQLAQQFNNFYHRHHILSEEDPARRQFLFGHRRGSRTRPGAFLAVVGNRRPGSDVRVDRSKSFTT